MDILFTGFSFPGRPINQEQNPCFNPEWVLLKWIAKSGFVFSMCIVSNSSKNMLPSLIKICFLTFTLSSCDFYTGVNQWFLLVLFWKRCHWWAGPEELFKGNKCGKAGFQHADRVHPGMRRCGQWKAKAKDLFNHFPWFMLLQIWVNNLALFVPGNVTGSLYW